MKLNEKINIGIGISGVVLMIIAIFISVKAIKSNEQIASKSGAFDKSNLTLMFGNFPIILSDNNDTIPIFYGGEFENNSINISGFPFKIYNRGGKDAENVEVIFTFPKLLHFLKDTNIIKVTLPKYTEFKRDIESLENLDIVMHKIQIINPNLTVGIPQPFILSETQLEGSIDTVSENKIIHFPYEVKFSYFFSSIILNRNSMTQKYLFRYNCRQSKNIDELLDAIIRKTERLKSQKYSFFAVYPSKKRLTNIQDRSLNEYQITDNAIKFIIIEDASPECEMIVAVYNNNNALEQLRVYDKNNFFTKEVLIK